MLCLRPHKSFFEVLRQISAGLLLYEKVWHFLCTLMKYKECKCYSRCVYTFNCADVMSCSDYFFETRFIVVVAYILTACPKECFWSCSYS